MPEILSYIDLPTGADQLDAANSVDQSETGSQAPGQSQIKDHISDQSEKSLHAPNKLHDCSTMRVSKSEGLRKDKENKVEHLNRFLSVESPNTKKYRENDFKKININQDSHVADNTDHYPDETDDTYYENSDPENGGINKSDHDWPSVEENRTPKRKRDLNNEFEKVGVVKRSRNRRSAEVANKAKGARSGPANISSADKLNYIIQAVISDDQRLADVYNWLKSQELNQKGEEGKDSEEDKPLEASDIKDIEEPTNRLTRKVKATIVDKKLYKDSFWEEPEGAKDQEGGEENQDDPEDNYEARRIFYPNVDCYLQTYSFPSLSPVFPPFSALPFCARNLLLSVFHSFLSP